MTSRQRSPELSPIETSAKQPIKIWFTDIYPGCDTFFKWLLEKKFNLILSPENPDFLIFSDFGDSHFTFKNSKKIYYTGENLRPDFQKCDFALTFDHSENPNHYRLPLYVLGVWSRWIEYHCINSWDALTQIKAPAEAVLKSKKKFCNFIVSNPDCEVRNKFFQLLNEYKPVDSAGSVFNNMGKTLPKEPELFFKSKLEFQRDYKFSIAFENSSYPGYLTEKILDPMLAHSLAIYWGDPLVHKDFNPKSFINAAAFRSLEELVSWVIKVDQIDALYCKYMEQPYFHDNKLNSAMNLENLLHFFETRVFQC